MQRAWAFAREPVQPSRDHSLDDTARVRATKAGLWMVRVEQRMTERASGHVRYMARTVLVFEVKE